LLVPQHIVRELLYKKQAQNLPGAFTALPREIIKLIITTLLEHNITYIKCLVLDHHIWKMARGIWVQMVRDQVNTSPQALGMEGICNAMSHASYRLLTINYTIKLTTGAHTSPRYIFRITLYSEIMNVYVRGYVVDFIRLDDIYVPVRRYQCSSGEFATTRKQPRKYGTMRTTLSHIKHILSTILPELLGLFYLES